LGELHYQGVTPLEEDERLTMPNYDPKDNFFLQLVHVALKIRGDLIGMDSHVGLIVSEDDAINCVPDSLFTFLNFVYGGQDILNQDGNPEDSKSTKQTKFLSVYQDIVYGVSEGRKWTPKPIGLSCTLHQMTRSKQLVDVFHSAGHTLNYHDVLKIDTELAEKSLETLDVNTGCVVPHNLKDKVFTHFTVYNIDINDSTLEGKNNVHATQMAAWQRGIGNGLQLDKLLPSSREILQIPPELDMIVPRNVSEGKSAPLFNENVEVETFNTTEDDEEDA
jgi:hypothetical protein